MFHPLLGWMALGGVVLLLVLAWLDDRLSRGRIAAAGQATALVGDMAQEGMANADVVRAMGLSPVIADRVAQAVGRANLASLEAAHGSSRILALSKFSRQALQSVMLGTGAYLVMKQEASPGAMIAATIVLGRAMAPIEAIVGHGRSLIQARQAWSRLSQFLADADAPLPMPLPAPVGVVVVDKLIYAVTRSTPLLKGLSFGLAPGELLGVIGPSGAGKTLLGRPARGQSAPDLGQRAPGCRRARPVASGVPGPPPRLPAPGCAALRRQRGREHRPAGRPACPCRGHRASRTPGRRARAHPAVAARL